MEDSVRIIALDPGGSTGWALADIGFNDDKNCYEIGYRHGQLEMREHHFHLWQLLAQLDPDILVSESFEYRNKTRSGLELVSREYIGIAKLFGTVNSIPVVLQTASMAKGFVTNDNIHLATGWVPSYDNRHAADAYRHLLYYLINVHLVGKDNSQITKLRNHILNQAWK